MSHIHTFTGKYILVCYFHFWYIIPSPCYTEEFLRCITSIALALAVLIGTRFFENTFPKKNKFKNSLQNQLPFVFFYILSINLYIDKEDINQWCYHLMTYLSLYIENCLFIYYFFLIFRFLEKKIGYTLAKQYENKALYGAVSFKTTKQEVFLFLENLGHLNNQDVNFDLVGLLLISTCSN